MSNRLNNPVTKISATADILWRIKIFISYFIFMLSKPITRYYRAPIAGFLMFVLFLNGLMIGYASSLGDKVVTTNSAWAKSANYDEIIKNRLQPSVQSSWTKIFNNGTVAGLALSRY